MGFRAIVWALKQAPCPTPISRLVLVAIADFADDANIAYPSHATLQPMVKCTSRAFQKAIKHLLNAKCLIDTGEREGRQENVHVYRLAVPDSFQLGKKPGSGDAAGLHGARSTSGQSDKQNHRRLNSGSLTGAAPANSQGEPTTKPNTPKTAYTVLPPKRQRRPNSGGRICPTWEPPKASGLSSELATQIAAWPTSRYDAQALAFRDYWLAQGGQRTKKNDWELAWSFWLRRHIERRLPTPTTSTPSEPAGEATVNPPEGAKEGSAALNQTEGLPRQLEQALRVRSKLVMKWLDDAAINFLETRPDHLGIEITVPPGNRAAVESSERVVLAVARSLGLGVDWMRVEICVARRTSPGRPNPAQVPPAGEVTSGGAKKAGAIF